jgi:hypothetical protein
MGVDDIDAVVDHRQSSLDAAPGRVILDRGKGAHNYSDKQL